MDFDALVPRTQPHAGTVAAASPANTGHVLQYLPPERLRECRVADDVLELDLLGIEQLQPEVIVAVRPMQDKARGEESEPVQLGHRLVGLLHCGEVDVRVNDVDVLRKHAGKVCVCELVPLFDLSQPTVSHHLKVLREAGIVGSERVGLWAYYYVNPEALETLSAWLS